MTNHSPEPAVDYLPPPPTAPPAYPYAGEPPFPPDPGAAHGAPWGVIGGHEDVVESGPRDWRLRRFLPRTLTTRLVSGVVSLVVVLVLATSICTYIALRSFLYDRLDQQLNSAADPHEVIALLNPTTGRFGGFAVPQKVWVQVLDKSGRPTDYQPAGPVLEPLSLDAHTRTSLAKADGKPRSVQTTDGQNIRVVAITQGLTLTTSDPSTGLSQRQSVSVVIGLSQTEVDHTLSRLLKLELAIGIGAIVLAFGATSYGVHYSLRRLRAVSTTAREVAAELSPTGAGLDRRVEVLEPETEVGQLADSMNTLLSAVETQFAERVASEERMRQFLADASHELRTPLTSIRGYAELSRMQGAGDEDNLARIEAEGTRMSRLVDDLLTLARTDQGGERAHEVLDVGAVLTDAIDGVRAAHPERRIDVMAEHGLTVRGDRDQLLRVVRNLATNAAVHTNPDGPIRVGATHEGGYVVIRVADAGPGLSPEDAAHVFERFWRADKSRTRARGGSGLGMSIVAALVQGHGGYVQFDSSVERGSTVTVRLPRA